MALDVFSSVRHLLKPEEICIDNWIFKLHYRVTVMLFLGSSAIGVSKQYFGDPINCQVDECRLYIVCTTFGIIQMINHKYI